MNKSERFAIDIPIELAQFIHAQIDQGLQRSGREVICEALRRMKASDMPTPENETKLNDLRKMVADSIAQGGSNTMEDVERSLEKTFQELENEGY